MKRGPKPKPRSTCTFPLCERPQDAKKLCSAHYARFKRWGDPEGIHAVRADRPRICTVARCTNPNQGKGLCNKHRERFRRTGTFEARPQRESGSGTVHAGYVVFNRKIDGQFLKIRRCRLVMEKMIGRELLPEETVHHRNGIKHDDRECNLELWSSTHPRGQRVSDLIEHAHYILRTYGVSKEEAA